MFWSWVLRHPSATPQDGQKAVEGVSVCHVCLCPPLHLQSPPFAVILQVLNGACGWVKVIPVMHGAGRAAVGAGACHVCCHQGECRVSGARGQRRPRSCSAFRDPPVGGWEGAQRPCEGCVDQTKYPAVNKGNLDAAWMSLSLLFSLGRKGSEES